MRVDGIRKYGSAQQTSMNELLYIIEDDEGVQEVYESAFEGLYNIRIFDNGKLFFDAFNEQKPDLVIVDIMLPDMDGYTIITNIRARDERIPIIVVSAKTDEMSFVKGLNKGADDYMAKPFSVMELLARVKAGLRRAKLLVKNYGDFGIDKNNYRVLYKSNDLQLTLKEFKLFSYLLSSSGRAVPREELFREVWGEDFMGETRALDMHIAEIRLKLADAGAPNVIQTVRGVGYKVE